jgi:hypothetical protein
MNTQRSLTRPRAVTVLGLVVGALGIAILWASGVAFPIYPPPGIVILLAGALLVGLAPWRWAPGVGALLGLVVFAGFLISPRAEQPVRPGRNQCRHRPRHPGDRRGYRAARGRAHHPGQLPQPGAGLPMRSAAAVLSAAPGARRGRARRC